MTNSDYFIDSRDGDEERYKTVRLKDGNTWFAEDLRYAVQGSQTHEDKTVRYYSGSNVHQAAPPGWRIATPYDWFNLCKVYSELPRELNIQGNGRIDREGTSGRYHYNLSSSTYPYFHTGFHPPVGFWQSFFYALFIRGLCPSTLVGQGDKSMSVIWMVYDRVFTDELTDRCFVPARCLRKTL